ncbi:MAG: putative copper-transporting ATPase [Acidimicrobiia bacterium]
MQNPTLDAHPVRTASQSPHPVPPHDPHAGHGAPCEPGAHAGHDPHVGHDAHAGHHVDDFRRRFWWSLLLAAPVVAFSEMSADLLGYSPPPHTAWIPPVLGTVIFVYGGHPFLVGAWREIRDRTPGMMLLIALAVSVAFTASLATSLGLGDVDLDFWWELALLVVIMLLGHWLEMKAIGQAQGALAALAELLPDTAERVTARGDLEEVPLARLAVGDVVLVRSGGRVPADGAIVDGAAELDESMITGESRPAPRGVGDRVVAGTVSTDSAIRVRVDAIGRDTALAGIQRLVAEAQASRSRAQVLADRAAALLFYVATASAVVTFVAWLAAGDATAAVESTVTVLVIACPHALGLAIPLVIALSTAVSARAGILVKDRFALERMRVVDAVLFDKTGTLTRGAPALSGVAVLGNGRFPTEASLLAAAAAVEAASEHPLARAIVAAASTRGPVPEASDFRSHTGRGVEATVEGTKVVVGGPAVLRERGLTEPAALRPALDVWCTRGASVLYVAVDDEVQGALALEDSVRPESAVAVDALHRRGVQVVMITGDARQVADRVAAQLGIDEVFAEVLPEDKDRAVHELQGRGLRVAMVGDGVNDAPALARADVGIAIGAGTDVAIESAGVVLASSDPRGVTGVIELSRASYRKMLQNLGWAAGYNVVAIPLAAGAFAWAGITLAPAAGAVLMSLSTIVVALNAQLLRRLRLRPEPVTADGAR